MCNEREQLIGYVYDECDAGERAAVQQHLESCAECRTEIAALRSVRDDLQSWEVPDHESVWKPFTPAPALAWWQQVPRWAMAAAAGAVIVSGAVGGAMATALRPQPPVTVASTASPATGVTQISITEADLLALERRIEARIASEVSQLNGQVVLASSRSTPVSLGVTGGDSLTRQVAELRAMNQGLAEAINGIYNEMYQTKKAFGTQQNWLKERVTYLAAAIEPQGR